MLLKAIKAFTALRSVVEGKQIFSCILKILSSIKQFKVLSCRF